VLIPIANELIVVYFHKVRDLSRDIILSHDVTGMQHEVIHHFVTSLGYGTPAKTLTKKDCEEINKPIMNAILTKMGIARSSLKAVVFRQPS
jgi:hypothetical protein